MRKMTWIGAAAAGLAAVGAATTAVMGVARAEASAPMTGEIRIAGSSTVAPVTIAVADMFREKHPEVQVSNATTGTGGGFKRFSVGETDISNASRPIKANEHKAAVENNVSYIEIPVAYDGLTICVNKANDWCRSLTIEQLRQIFADGSTVTRWSDLNPSWPNERIMMFIPGTDSGTFDYFKEVVIGDGNVRSDVTASEDDNILVTGIENNRNAIGFFGCAYYFENQNRLQSVAIDGGNGPVKPTAETIESGEYAPFSRPLFIYVNSRSAQRPEVREFVNFYLENAPKAAEKVGYVKLPASVYYRAQRFFRQGKTGTHYLTETGESRHGSLNELYR